MSANTCPLCLNLCLPSKDLVSLTSKVLIKNTKSFLVIFSLLYAVTISLYLPFQKPSETFPLWFPLLAIRPPHIVLRSHYFACADLCMLGPEHCTRDSKTDKIHLLAEGSQDFYKYFIRWFYLFLSQISDSSSWSVAHSHCQKPACVASFRGWILVPVQFSAYRIIIVS